MINHRPFAVDFTKNCTSLLELTISTILSKMRQDGVYDELYSANLAKNSDQSCGASSNIKTASLTINDMGGIFILLSCGILISVLIAIFEYVYKSRNPTIDEVKNDTELDKNKGM